MTALHHATTKRAAKLGIRTEPTDGGDTFVLTFGEFHKTVAKAEVKAFLDLFQEAVEGDEGVEALDWDSVDGDDDEVNAKSTRSIVPERYRKKYAPNQDSCGDDIAVQLREYLETTKDDGSPGIDRAKLDAFARANGFWADKYAALNNGQTRMNVGNRLRAHARKNPEWQPTWP